jgi:flagellar basal body-associated protein FliL
MKRHMTEAEGRKETKVVWLMVIVIVLLIALALYGWLSGAWQADPLNSGYGTSDKS